MRQARLGRSMTIPGTSIRWPKRRATQPEAAGAQPPLPPGPDTPRLFLSIAFLRDPMAYVRKAHRRYGDIFRLNLIGSPPLVYVASPELAKQAFATDRDIGLAGPTRRGFLERMVGPNSVLVLDGEDYMRQRRLLGQAFQSRYMSSYREQIAKIAAEEIETWPDGEVVQLRPRLKKITVDVLLSVVFGVEDRERVDRLRVLQESLVQAAVKVEALGFILSKAKPFAGLEPLLSRVPGTPAAQFTKVRQELDALLYDEMARRRALPDFAERGDVLSRLLRVRDSEGRGMTDEELRDAVVTLLEAGIDTTAVGLSWLVERLVRHPDVLAKVDAEIAAGGDEYQTAVIKETLRTRPVLVVVARELTQDIELGGYRIPTGWWVTPSITLLHERPASFPQPEEFRPERFLDADEAARASWHPFGGGRRQCLGTQFAMLQMKTVVEEILARRELAPPQGTAEEQLRSSHLLLVPERDCSVVTRRRVPAGAAR